jgi:hypothetical protein
MLYMSSTLPDTTTEGTADITPETNRPTAAAATDGIAPTTMHDKQYNKLDDTYTDFRPNASEYGGKTMPPKACPNWYLFNH